MAEITAEQLAEFERFKAMQAAAGTGLPAVKPNPFATVAAAAQVVNAFAPPVAPGGGLALGLLVPIEVQTGRGLVTCHIQLGPEAAANSQTVANAIALLAQMGMPIRAYVPKPKQGGGNW